MTNSTTSSYGQVLGIVKGATHEPLQFFSVSFFSFFSAANISFMIEILIDGISWDFFPIPYASSVRKIPKIYSKPNSRTNEGNE